MSDDITQPPPAVKTAVYPRNIFSRREVPQRFLRRPYKSENSSATDGINENNLAADDNLAKKVKRSRRFKNAS